MTSPEHVLDLIDNAINDWQTSPDAMRWTVPTTQPRIEGSLTWEISPEASRFLAALLGNGQDSGVICCMGVEIPYRLYMGLDRDTAGEDVTPSREQRALAFTAARRLARDLKAARGRPGQLAANGHAYRRRQQARRRRR